MRNRLLRTSPWILPAVFLIVSGVAIDTPPRARFPEEDMGRDSLPQRKADQMEAARRFGVFHDFQFSDRLKDSGISFVHHAVDDVTKHMRMGHYDHGSAVAVADIDGDGLYDIYFANQVGGNELWKNIGGGKFRNITKQAGVGLPDRISVGAAFADIDNDGHPDLFVTTVRGGNVLFKNDGRGHFTDVTQEAGLGLVAHSSGAFFFDFDNDGLVDLLVCNVGKYTQDTKGPNGEYVAIPTGTTSNRNGLGATVRVRSGRQIYTRYNDGKSGYLAQSVLPLYFGLGDSAKIDSVEVDWPSSRKQTVTADLTENQTLHITEPK